jgi:nucleotide-binding universal stress UspA family protein
MSLRDILVVLDGTARGKAALALAVNLAVRDHAHLSGLCPLEVLYPDDLAFSVGGYPDLFATPVLASQLEADATDRAQEIGENFKEQLASHGLKGDWLELMGSAGLLAARRAALADLVVLGQMDPQRELPKAAGNLVEDVLMRSGRPVLLVPYAGNVEQVGRNVLLGWNGSREAVRAAHDAMALFAEGAKVTVLSVDPLTAADGDPILPPSDLAAHLTRHGFEVSAARTVADGITPSDALLSYACDISADLIVIGGYGHSRLRELILGGVTRDLLQHMTVPVLMSH